MRVAIVNDVAMAVEVLRRVVSAGGHEIAWIALDGAEAVEKCEADTPDLILMDLLMPVMDGVKATATIMKRCPCAILVVTATVSGNAAKVFDAMGYGALDATGTPVLGPGGSLAGAEPLLEKMATIGRLLGKAGARPRVPSGAVAPRLVAIGASTGGPKALAQVLSALPRRLDYSVVVVQHVDLKFAPGLAEWLSEYSGLHVAIAEEGLPVEPGTAFLAATNDHLVLGEDRTFHYTVAPRDLVYRPSVDVFFASIREFWRDPGVAVLLTGMGRDGAAGLLDLRTAGWHTIAQDERTSVVYGMPRAAAEIGATNQILPLDEIGPAILRRLDIDGAHSCENHVDSRRTNEQA